MAAIEQLDDDHSMLKGFTGMTRDTVRLIIEAVGLAAVIYSLYLTREALHSGTRPLVVANDFRVSTYADDPAKIEFELEFTNPGTFPARNLWFEVEMDPGGDISFSRAKSPLILTNATQILIGSASSKKGQSSQQLAKSIRDGSTSVKVELHYEGMNGKKYSSTYTYFAAHEDMVKQIPKELDPPKGMKIPSLFLISDS